MRVTEFARVFACIVVGPSRKAVDSSSASLRSLRQIPPRLSRHPAVRQEVSSTSVVTSCEQCLFVFRSLAFLPFAPADLFPPPFYGSTPPAPAAFTLPLLLSFPAFIPALASLLCLCPLRAAPSAASRLYCLHDCPSSTCPPPTNQPTLPLRSVVLFDLLVNILAHNLAEPAYEAEVAQLEYKLVAGEHGLVVKVKGFNHKLPVSERVAKSASEPASD